MSGFYSLQARCLINMNAAFQMNLTWLARNQLAEGNWLVFPQLEESAFRTNGNKSH